MNQAPFNPRRIQRQRSKGWRMPANTVCVTRPSVYGNPFKVGEKLEDGTVISPSLAVELYKAYLSTKPSFRGLIRRFLRGKNLACWCKLGLPCHADVLLKVANGVEPSLKTSV